MVIQFAHLQKYIYSIPYILPENCTCGNNPPVTCNLNCYIRTISILVLNCASEKTEECALATFFLAALHSINCYCKLTLCHITEPCTLYFSPTILCDAYNSTVYTEFSAVKISAEYYVGRICIEGYYYIEYFKYFKGYNFSHLSGSYGKIEHVDVMPLYSDIALPINCNAPFSVSGHYPIIAYIDESGNPAYLAYVKVPSTGDFTVTIVHEGDSMVKYYDNDGETVVTDDFKVLARDQSSLRTELPGFQAPLQSRNAFRERLGTD
ncbi:hypothetical protein SCHPADRAFT_948289 [Schizopora paradoxa]|uniref:Uncharacterized protein n=1 Tax=Schizopora paradoxa TaxID=27342 RepID=A0A0H2QWW9_9AGAM|nr:hypothetical protein SCHPADRAFT_948289 [Schizopora paradoxa]